MAHRLCTGLYGYCSPPIMIIYLPTEIFTYVAWCLISLQLLASCPLSSLMELLPLEPRECPSCRGLIAGKDSHHYCYESLGMDHTADGVKKPLPCSKCWEQDMVSKEERWVKLSQLSTGVDLQVGGASEMHVFPLRRRKSLFLFNFCQMTKKQDSTSNTSWFLRRWEISDPFWMSVTWIQTIFHADHQAAAGIDPARH